MLIATKEVQAGFLSQLLDAYIGNMTYLPFSSSDEDETPRYLFRVFTPYSQGTTDMHWVKSMAASDELPCSKADIFWMKNKQLAAGMLNRHLRWQKNPHDNLVSWTSSLLVALVHIFYLQASIHTEVSLDEIQLLVVDTSMLPKRAFMRDLDLIRHFRSVDKNLRNFEDLRHKQSSWWIGYYYFGEYLSQGALRVKGYCQMVSAQKIVDGGLYDIRKEFIKFAGWKQEPESARWANAVLEMRHLLYHDYLEPQRMTRRAKVAALDISRLFGPHFQVPIAANLVALSLYQDSDLLTLSSFGAFDSFTGSCVRH